MFPLPQEAKTHCGSVRCRVPCGGALLNEITSYAHDAVCRRVAHMGSAVNGTCGLGDTRKTYGKLMPDVVSDTGDKAVGIYAPIGKIIPESSDLKRS
jgi:hypothetical protein